MRDGRCPGHGGSRFGLLLVLAVWTAWLVPAAAQQLGLPQSAILTISSERMFAESAFGRRVAREIDSQSAVLAAENRRIEVELTAEEKDLTDRRPGMAPDAFRALADAFDTKVQDIRRRQDAKARALVQFQEDEQVRFLQAARPVLVELMRESGAGAILERSSVFLSANAIDITELAITRLDEVLGEAPPTGDN
ncbi:OmpH family outer membrane protein [Sedimentitalea sp. JM2-8]|uniref:OmpH family outer membrane protein n=1 Tax=Sedimentitalea xiamensis TaxID=3050037 RepID=A0ABT7FBQ0_9RHOB|nr:OmpH family outer membrane protein [Sedimentitalea xiamensis]MDK3072541.1 OmpH family outer membrane protein [Sedimentitalea xiamensis]